ncbi:IucA/IucC family siderophore biosynthesis protein [Streptomyces roseirectus]|uniref:IucA/IucC family siderophore biosynthesis protein n=1 Tax=Streptomyces roseirectus TaxID=2768066 RepID=A0A7H0ITI3_9ACTN|nr:IucA/IucC family protein [Streptomyces roseirectus]QNP76099.1 IucA/IucC family siderophore biosynthesis protein [Streptomyces roseirectus]
MLRVLGALLREDVVGLRSRGTLVERPDGPWISRGGLLLPVRPDGFQGDHTARLPLLVRDGAELTSFDAVLAALRDLAEPEDRAGFDAFAEECRQTAETVRLHDETRSDVLGALAARYGDDPADWPTLALDTLAARLDHPVYPTARGRAGLTPAQLRLYAPEFHPRFTLRWVAVPRETVTFSGTLPEVWPTLDTLGLPQLTDTHVPFPVHPLTVDAVRALDVVVSDVPYLDVVPTLSMRTVAVVGDPSLHLKLPLATSTLGLRNKRSIKPGTLVDGVAGQRLVEAVLEREPRFRERVLHADETTYAHAGHELLAVLCRRLPSETAVPLAALLAEAPSGRPVVDHLADRYFGGDRLAFFEALFTLLLDWQTTLFGYGVALESHQQNVSVVLAPGTMKLLFKDDDGPRVNTERLGYVPEFDDPRTFTTDDGPVADVFTTITLHLCAGAYAFGLGDPALLDLVRDRLTEAVERLGGDAGAVLRKRVLEATRLPVKAMVSAGTLLSKERSGAADVNKHYTDGPNYLLRAGS